MPACLAGGELLNREKLVQQRRPRRGSQVIVEAATRVGPGIMQGQKLVLQGPSCY